MQASRDFRNIGSGKETEARQEAEGRAAPEPWKEMGRPAGKHVPRYRWYRGRRAARAQPGSRTEGKMSPG